MDIGRAYSTIQVKGISEERREIEGIATSPSPDRVGDVVEPLGGAFKTPMPLLWQHDAKQPIGHVISAKATKDGIKFVARLAKVDEPGRLKDRLDEAWQSLRAGLVRAVSIGFRALEANMMKEGGIRFVKWEWLELSLVTIPANQDCSITQIRSIDTALRAALGTEQTGETKREHPGATGLSKHVPKGNPKMKTFTEQIAAFVQMSEAKSARMDELMNGAAERGETLNNEEQDEYDRLSDEVKQIDQHLTRLKAHEERAKKAAVPVVAKDAESASRSRGSGAVVLNVEDRLPKGIEFARYVMCLATAKGVLGDAVHIAQQRYPDNGRIISTLKAAVAAGTTTDSTWASPLVDYQQFAGDFVEFLRPQTIIGRFGANGIPSLRRVPFNIQIPAQTSGGDAYWVGEGAPKPLTKFDFTRYTLRWAKVAAICVLTEELVRFSNPSAEALVRDSLRDAVVARIDEDFVDPTKASVSNVSPASITNGVPDIVSSGTDADAIRYDVRALFQSWIDANLSPQNAVWIMSGGQALALSLMVNALGQPEFPGIGMNGGTFQGIPVIVSEYVGDIVILVNASEIYLSDDGQVVIDASREASLQMLDNPTNHSGTATPTTMVSMFQTNSVALRAERFINWQRRRTEAVRWLSGVAWGGALSGS